MRVLAGLLAGAVALAGCSPGASESDAPETQAQAGDGAATGAAGDAAPALGASDDAASESAAGEVEATPMEERVATLGLLNKRNNLSQDLEMTPGESRRVGNVIVRLAACERTAPWEMPRETGAFVQVLVRDNAAEGEGRWDKVFSGWLFRNSPSRNVVEHPIYDVWVKDCAMSFPGEEDPASASNAA
ncbi:DUF2155 domain-containing protein [Pelagerythrobacter marinus]|uniref:DUF2155 domain-containing protein n=1 Tax=Pelagerythrobacter marinus TaxID=538382 RepID=UPI002036966A|nr:DUF2155 domain-containing protein [Pelagerythrobacter marinus]USA39707.1 DUF2155 domain-containing protein [Pelagerythrobacter marinus]WPZ06162.1 DUF2155 domain-containing protein [Pelagerythrobacter marinus]